MIKKTVFFSLVVTSITQCIVTNGTLNQLYGSNGQNATTLATPRVYDSLSVIDATSYSGPDRESYVSKYIVLGSSANQLALLSYFQDGIPEQNFGDAGIFLDSRFAISTAATGSARSASMILLNQQLIVTATNNVTGDIIITKYNLNGTPTSDNYLVQVALEAPGSSTGIAARAGRTNPQIVVTANTTTGRLIFIDGSTTSVISPSFGFDALFNDIKIQFDGKIVVVGTADFGISTAFFAARFLATGALDTTFGNGNGYQTTAIGGGGRASTLAIQADGKIVVTGVSQTGKVAAVRYTNDGKLDASFGTQGIVTTIFDASDSVRINIQDDGKLLLSSTPAGIAFSNVRLESNGSLDNSFGSAGAQTGQIFGAASALGSASVAGTVSSVGTTVSVSPIPLLPLSTGPIQITMFNAGTSATQVLTQSTVVDQTTPPFLPAPLLAFFGGLPGLGAPIVLQ